MNKLKFLNIFIFVLIVSIFAISIALIVDDNILEGVILLLISLGLCVAEYVKYRVLNKNKDCNKTGTFEGSSNHSEFYIEYKLNCDRQSDLDKKKEVIYEKLKYDNYGKFYFDPIETNILNTIEYYDIKINTEDELYKIIKGDINFNKKQNENNFADFKDILEYKKIISGYEKDNIKTKLNNEKLYNQVVNEIKKDDPILVYIIICICVRQNEINEYKKETFRFLSTEDKIKVLTKRDVIDYLNINLN